MKKPLAWWVWPSVLTGSVAALGALGSVAINYATYAGLPKRVEAGEVKNAKQDEEIIDLKGIAKEISGYTRAMQQQAANAPPQPTRRQEPVVIRETDEDGTWCCETTVEQCWKEQTWERCK